MAPIAVAGRIGVITKEIDISSDPLLAQTLLGGVDELFKNPLPCFVVSHEVIQGVTLRRRVLRM
ncbi:unannotated protein [freshwater metagenome]|uniref:Unannotated protein n=1 Tax=freshwater metagenome TaxID=449393 RepID=A0A6J6SI99_9ZZZZ